MVVVVTYAAVVYNSSSAETPILLHFLVPCLSTERSYLLPCLTPGKSCRLPCQPLERSCLLLSLGEPAYSSVCRQGSRDACSLSISYWGWRKHGPPVALESIHSRRMEFWNSITEQTLEAQISKFIDVNQENWDKLFPQLLLAYWSAFHNTPAQLTFGRDLRLPIGLASVRRTEEPSPACAAASCSSKHQDQR